jgi:hypothetical protein
MLPSPDNNKKQVAGAEVKEDIGDQAKEQREVP